jgi:hypothetical protein
MPWGPSMDILMQERETKALMGKLKDERAELQIKQQRK